MIIEYDTRPNATIDEKLRSLIKSVQLALDETGIRESNNLTSQNTDLASLTAYINGLNSEVSSYSDAITSIDERVTELEGTTIPSIDSRVSALESQQPLPAAPVTDGSYILKVTVTDGTPTYTWEVQGV